MSSNKCTEYTVMYPDFYNHTCFNKNYVQFENMYITSNNKNTFVDDVCFYLLHNSLRSVKQICKFYEYIRSIGEICSI